jgi:hypothetical protein
MIRLLLLLRGMLLCLWYLLAWLFESYYRTSQFLIMDDFGRLSVCVGRSFAWL